MSTTDTRTTIETPYHCELIEFFDRQFSYLRIDKEPKDIWGRGRIYQDGEVNRLFLAFRHGAAYGKAVAEA